MPKRICDFELENKGRSRIEGGGDIHTKKCNIRYDVVVTFENILKAWNDFVSGKRKREDVNEYALYLSVNLFEIVSELQSGRCVHGGYEEYIICDPKKRIIHKASVKDSDLNPKNERTNYEIVATAN